VGVYVGSFRATYLACHSQQRECVVLKEEPQGSSLAQGGEFKACGGAKRLEMKSRDGVCS